MKIGINIYNLRKVKGITQEDLAHELNVSRQSISLWETDQTTPSIENLLLMCKIFEVTMDELCQGVISKNIPITNEKKDYIAHGITIFDESIYKLSQSFIYKKHLMILWVSIILSIFIGIGLVIGNNTILIFFPIICCIIFVVKLIQLNILIKKQLNLMLNTDKNRTAEFWFYNDRFEFFAKTDNSNANYSKRYDEITSVTDNEKFLYLSFEGKFTVIEKAKIEGDLQGIILLFKNKAKKYKSFTCSIENKDLSLSDKKVRILKPTLLVLFILSLCSLFFALMLVAIASEANGFNNDSSAMIESMWLFYLILPIPLSSLVLGFFVIKNGMKGKKNIVVGIIFSVLLIMFGSFSFTFGSMFSHDYTYVAKISQKISFALPTTGRISTQDWTKGEQSNSDSIILYYTSNVKFTDQIEIDAFEEAIGSSSLWTTSIIGADNMIGSFYYLSTKDYDFFLIFNCDTHQYNSFTSSGTYNLIYLAYKSSSKQMTIIEYQLQKST